MIVVIFFYFRIACVASVSSRGSSRKPEQEQKKHNDGGGEGNEGFRSNFRAITRLETLATQANFRKAFYSLSSRKRVMVN